MGSDCNSYRSLLIFLLIKILQHFALNVKCYTNVISMQNAVYF